MAGLSPELKSRLRSICEFRKDLLRFFLPPLCAVCDRALAARENWVCRGCMADLAARAGQRRREVDLGGEKSLIVVYSLPYTRSVARLVKDLKYADRPGLAGVLAPFLAFALWSMSLARPVLVPVPLHGAKKRERGYNQSRLLCEGVSRMTGIEVAAGVLRRRRNTSPQAGLNGARRLRNMKNAFEAAAGEPLAGRHVLLVDDVVTTGATLAEAADALKAAGAVEVTGCAVASSV